LEKYQSEASLLSQILVRTVCLTVLLTWLFGASAVKAQNDFALPVGTHNSLVAHASSPCRILYLGFVGALESPNDKDSGIVQIRQTLQDKEYPDVCAESFSPYAWIEGRDWLLKYFPAHDGVLAAQGLEGAPRVILVGHSMGGWAMLAVARELRSRDIPVELTIQVDSVGITDHTIPRNVKSAAIFHANDALMFMTTKHLRREDPQHTKVVADTLVPGAGHISVTRDPRIRQLVMKTVQNLRSTFAAQSTSNRTQTVPESTRGIQQK
jgi:hypothetical protein